MTVEYRNRFDKLALKIENREMVRRECGLRSVYGGKPQFNLPNAKNTSSVTNNKTQVGEIYR